MPKLTMYITYITYMLTFSILLYIDTMKINKLGRRVAIGKNRFGRRHIIMIFISLQLIYFFWITMKYRVHHSLKISNLDMILFIVYSLVIIALGSIKVIRKNSIYEKGLVVNTDPLKWSNVLSFDWHNEREENVYTLTLVVKYSLLYKTWIRKGHFRIESEMKKTIQSILESHQVPRKQV